MRLVEVVGVVAFVAGQNDMAMMQVSCNTQTLVFHDMRWNPKLTQTIVQSHCQMLKPNAFCHQSGFVLFSMSHCLLLTPSPLPGQARDTGLTGHLSL